MIKLIGLGFIGYFKEFFNIFDFSVVLASLLEITLTNNVSVFGTLRAFRFFKILKKAKDGTSLRLLLDSIEHTITTIGNFTVLLALFIYVYSLLGMQFFAGKLRFDSEDRNYNPNGPYLPRANFDTILWASVTIFQILVGDDWNKVMYDSFRATGWVSVFYFISLVLFGNIIMLNLFLALLLGNFNEVRQLFEEKKRLLKERASTQRLSMITQADEALSGLGETPRVEESSNESQELDRIKRRKISKF